MAILTELDIVNAACAQIGADPLQDLSEETVGGQAGSLIYQSFADLALDLAPWTFASQTRQLNLLTDVVSMMGHAYVFQLPAERIGAPARLIDDISDPDSAVTSYAYEGERVHASCSPLYAVIKIRQIPSLWPGTFKMAVITGLAGYLALSLSHDKKLAADKQEEAFGPPSMGLRGGLMGVALQVDGRAQGARKLPAASNPLLAGHLGAGNSCRW